MTKGYKFTTEDRQAIVDTATRLGVSPAALTMAMGYETEGTMNPDIRGGAHNAYEGLIQMGPSERKQFGYRPGMTVAEQVQGPVFNYLKARGLKPGMGLAHIYSIINAGSLTRDGQPRWNARDQNGTVREHVQRITQQYMGKGAPGNFTPPMNVGETAQGRQMPLGMGRGQIKTGPQVRQLQQQLADAGYKVNVDGQYGPQTAAAVRAFEQSSGLTVDRGVAGPQVQQRLAGNTATGDIMSARNLAPGGPGAVPDANPLDIAFGRVPNAPPQDVAQMGAPPPMGPGNAPGGPGSSLETAMSASPYDYQQGGLSSGGLPQVAQSAPVGYPGAGNSPHFFQSTQFGPNLGKTGFARGSEYQGGPVSLMHGMPEVGFAQPGDFRLNHDFRPTPPTPLADGISPADTVAGSPSYYRAEKAANALTRFHPQQAEMERARHAAPASAPVAAAPPPASYDTPTPTYVKYAAGMGYPGVGQPLGGPPQFDASRFASEPYAGGMSPINPPQFDTSRFASEPNAGGMAPIPEQGNSINDVIAGVKGIPGALGGAVMGGLGGASDWLNAQLSGGIPTSTASPLPPPAVSPGASYADDHYGAGLSARPYPSGVPYSPLSQFSGSGSTDYLGGSAGQDRFSPGGPMSFGGIPRDNTRTMYANGQRDISPSDYGALPPEFGSGPSRVPTTGWRGTRMTVSADPGFMPSFDAAGPGLTPAGGEPTPLTPGGAGYTFLPGGIPQGQSGLRFDALPAYTPPQPVSLQGSPVDQAKRYAAAAQSSDRGGYGGGYSGPGGSGSTSSGGGSSPFSWARVNNITNYLTSNGVSPGNYVGATPPGYTAPNFSPGSGGSTYAYHADGYGGGTFVDSHGNVHSY